MLPNAHDCWAAQAGPMPVLPLQGHFATTAPGAQECPPLTDATAAPSPRCYKGREHGSSLPPASSLLPALPLGSTSPEAPEASWQRDLVGVRC